MQKTEWRKAEHHNRTVPLATAKAIDVIQHPM
jgi:hypothetical protein